MKTPLRLTSSSLVTLVLAFAGSLGAQTTPASTTPTDVRPAESAPGSSYPKDGTLRFNFRGAPLETVLNYLSDAAGFVIVLETSVRGTVDMWSSQPVSKTEAVQLLNLALNKNGYTATLQGRNLIVASKDDAKKRNIPIRTGNDPREIPANAEMVMQVIPLRHITASKVAADIATLIPSSATLTANEDSNSLVVTDTNLNIRHVVEIVSALDLSVQSDSAMRIFKLRNADPTEMAALLTQLFQTNATSGTGSAAAGATPFAGGPPGMAAFLAARSQGGSGRARDGNNRGTSGSRNATPISAVADARTQSVIVTGSKDALQQIGEIIAQLDESGARKQKVFVYTLENADVGQVETVLKNLFETNSTRSSTTNQNDPLANRANNNTQQTSGGFLNNTSSGSGLR
ncbi:MAG TPA: secretin N-terminal domain-containing protein [Opitutaceae bacterium]|nr:secretin N-terminal domain-containing protein [Opitutaceae bacterium]